MGSEASFVSARVCTGIDPGDVDRAYVVVALRDGHLLRELLDSSYEGEGAFYVAATDAWAVHKRDADRLRIRIERPGDPVAHLDLWTDHAGESMAKTTLVVESNDDWPIIEEQLRSGQILPVIVAPQPTSEHGKG